MHFVLKHKKMIIALVSLLLVVGIGASILIYHLTRPEVIYSDHEPLEKYGRSYIRQNSPVTWVFDKSGSDQSDREFQFIFDERCAMEASCTAGKIAIRYDSYYGSLVLSWKPSQDGELIEKATISFTMREEDELVGKGKIKIECAELAEDKQSGTYVATLTNYDLFLSQSQNHAVLAPPQASKELVKMYPDYFLNGTFDGVEVYVSKAYSGNLICYVRANKEDISNYSGIHGLPSMDMEEAKAFLADYDADDVFVYTVGKPMHSSSRTPVEEDPDVEVVERYREMLGVS